ncbi:hypothetical protein Tco_0005679 [Tanacetum coccineum]
MLYCGTKESTSSQDKGQREGKAPMISEETPKKSKEQILQEEASLAEAIRLDTLQKEEVAKQVHLDSLLAQRIAEEEELNEQQKKRKAQVQFEAQHYTNKDWDLIRVKELKKKYFAEERAKAKRNKPMTQSQLKTYMMNYLKNQGTWKLSQLKKLSFEEVKEEFDKLVKQVGEQEESTTTGTETPINPVPVAMKTPSVATYKIIKHGKKGVHHVSTEKGQDISMLVEKDYPLIKGLATLMLSNKLRVDQQSEMADELLTKIYNIANKSKK